MSLVAKADTETERRAVTGAVEQLLALQCSDGAYRAGPDDAQWPAAAAVDVAAQARVTWAVGLAVGRGIGGEAAVASLRKASAVLIDRLVTAPATDDLVAVTPTDRILADTDLDDGAGADAGPDDVVAAAGLTLRALAGAERRLPGTVAVRDLEGIGRFLIHLLARPTSPRPAHRFSGSTVGWACLGLLELAAIVDDRAYRRVVEDVLISMASDDGGGEPEPRLLVAVAAMLAEHEAVLTGAGRATLSRFGRRTHHRLLDARLATDRDRAATAEALEVFRAAHRSIDLGQLAGPVEEWVRVGTSALARRASTDANRLGRDEAVSTVLALIGPPDLDRRQVVPASPRWMTATEREIDVRPYMIAVDELVAGIDSTTVDIRPLTADTSPGLFRLAVDLAARDDHVLYRVEQRVIGPGRHVEQPAPIDRHAWNCRRLRLVVGAEAELILSAGSSSFELRSGQVCVLDPLVTNEVENTGPVPIALLDIYTRPRTPELLLAPFDLVRSGIEVEALMAELLAGEPGPEPETGSPSGGETSRIVLRASRSCPGTAVERPSPLLLDWLDRFCGRAGLEPDGASLVELAPGGHVPAHIDHGPYRRLFDRYHLVLTGDSSTLTAGRQTVRPRPGQLWRFDNQLLHHATNRGVDRQVHLVFDAKPW